MKELKSQVSLILLQLLLNFLKLTWYFFLPQLILISNHNKYIDVNYY